MGLVVPSETRVKHCYLLYASLQSCNREYYFSVENLCKDVFMRNQMDSEGHVPLSLVANFNRVRYLTTDLELIKDALRSSKEIELNGDKMRRRNDWPTWILPKEDNIVPVSTHPSTLVPSPESPHPV